MNAAPLRRIAILLDATNAYGRGVGRGVRTLARTQHHWRIHFAATPPLPQGPLPGADAFIAELADRTLTQRLLKHGAPLVNVSTHLAQPAVPTVGVDTHGVGRLAAIHLMDAGYETLGFIGPTWHFGPARCEAGMADVVRRRGGRLESLFPAGRPPTGPAAADWSERIDAIGQWLQRLPRPVGVFTWSDAVAEQVLEACLAAGLAVPGEVGILGCGNDEWRCEPAEPGLSSVMLPGEAVGIEATRLLARLLAGAGPPRRQATLFSPTGVAVRGSTLLADTPDAHVNAALAVIRSRGHESLTVMDLVASVGISRRALEQRFREHLGRTPLALIQHRRLELAQRLLVETRMKVKDIAEAAGFTSPEHFSVAFKRLTGTTPGGFRRAAGGADVLAG